MFRIHYAMHIAKMQHAVVRFFGFEQPGRASSWDLECIKSVAALPGVNTIYFDMCMFGKISPQSLRGVVQPCTRWVSWTDSPPPPLKAPSSAPAGSAGLTAPSKPPALHPRAQPF